MLRLIGPRIGNDFTIWKLPPEYPPRWTANLCAAHIQLSQIRELVGQPREEPVEHAPPLAPGAIVGALVHETVSLNAEI